MGRGDASRTEPGRSAPRHGHRRRAASPLRRWAPLPTLACGLIVLTSARALASPAAAAAATAARQLPLSTLPVLVVAPAPATGPATTSPTSPTVPRLAIGAQQPPPTAPTSTPSAPVTTPPTAGEAPTATTATTAPPDGTILPPADKADVSIVPTDEQPEEHDGGPRSGARRLERSDGLDPGDIDPVAALGWTLLVLLSAAATAVTAARLTRTLHVWRSPATVRASGFGPAGEPATSFSLLVPAAAGEPGLGATLDSLAGLDHPAVEVLAVVGRDDADNRGTALAATARWPRRVRSVVVDVPVGRQRATAQDVALAEVGGAVVGVFRPGDEVDPRLLRHVDGCFAHDRADALQGGILLVPRGRRRWFTVRQVVDRYLWSRSRLQLHAQQRFMPLDDTTAFVRADLLRSTGGWPRQSSAPGCDLGVRLSVDGARLLARYDPALATRATTAGTVRALLRDETRRVQGQLQALRAGVWRRLPTRRQRLRARWALARSAVEQIIAMTALVAVAGVLVAAPVGLALLALAPVVPGVVTLVVEQTALADLRRLHGPVGPHELRAPPKDRISLLVSALPFQALQAVAAVTAVGSLVAEAAARIGRSGRSDRRRPRLRLPRIPAASRRRPRRSVLDPLDDDFDLPTAPQRHHPGEHRSQAAPEGPSLPRAPGSHDQPARSTAGGPGSEPGRHAGRRPTSPPNGRPGTPTADRPTGPAAGRPGPLPRRRPTGTGAGHPHDRQGNSFTGPVSNPTPRRPGGPTGQPREHQGDSLTDPLPRRRPNGTPDSRPHQRQGNSFTGPVSNPTPRRPGGPNDGQPQEPSSPPPRSRPGAPPQDHPAAPAHAPATGPPNGHPGKPTADRPNHPQTNPTTGHPGNQTESRRSGRPHDPTNGPTNGHPGNPTEDPPGGQSHDAGAVPAPVIDLAGGGEGPERRGLPTGGGAR